MKIKRTRIVFFGCCLVVGAVCLAVWQIGSIDPQPSATNPFTFANPEINVAHGASEELLQSSRESKETEEMEEVPEFPYPPSLSGSRVYVDAIATFQANWEKAKEGDTDAMFEISQIIKQCSRVYPHRSYKSYLTSDVVAQGYMPPDLLAAMEDLFPDCAQINELVPEGLTPRQWSDSWFRNAYIEGHPIAVLDTIAGNRNDWSSPGHDVEVLLNEGLRDGHPFAFDHAALYVANKSDRNESNERAVVLATFMWQYLGCTHNSACSEQAFRELLAKNLYEHEVEAILGAAERYKSYAGQNSQIDFLNPQSVETLFVDE